MIELRASKDEYALNGTDVDSCLFVCNLSIGRMSKGIRYISREECTEELLAYIEANHTLRVWA